MGKLNMDGTLPMKVGQADPCETEPLAPMKVPISEVFQSRRFMSRKDLAQIDAAIDQEAFLPPEPLPRLDEVEEEEDEACVQDKLFISTDEGANDEQRQQQPQQQQQFGCKDPNVDFDHAFFSSRPSSLASTCSGSGLSSLSSSSSSFTDPSKREPTRSILRKEGRSNKHETQTPPYPWGMPFGGGMWPGGGMMSDWDYSSWHQWQDDFSNQAAGRRKPGRRGGRGSRTVSLNVIGFPKSKSAAKPDDSKRD